MFLLVSLVSSDLPVQQTQQPQQQHMRTMIKMRKAPPPATTAKDTVGASPGKKPGIGVGETEKKKAIRLFEYN